MISFSDRTMADMVVDTESGHGKLTLKDGNLGLLCELIGFEFSDDPTDSGKWDSVSWKNTNPMEDGKE